MAKTLQFKRYSTPVLATTTGANGEIIVDTTKFTLTVHDGVTAGGYAMVVANTSGNLINLGVSGNVYVGKTVYANTVNATGNIYATIITTATGSSSNLIIDPDGLGDVVFTPNTEVFVLSTNTAVNVYTGAMIIAGGLGVAGNVYGGNVYSNGSLVLTSEPIGIAAFNAANTAAQTVPQNAQTATYALQLSDSGKHIYYTQSSNTILYIPNAGQVLFQNGATVMIVSQTTSGANVTITPNTGVSLYLAGNTTSASRNVTTYGMATLIKVAANTWFVNGTGVV